MPSKHPLRIFPGSLAFFAILLLILTGVSCTAPPKQVAKDPFFDKWEALASESRGHSPTPRTRQIVIPEIQPPPEAVTRALPSLPLSLKMRRADIKVVLRSMARIAGIHLMINEAIKGEVTFDFQEVPWNQAFNSLLRSQGLSFFWEGDIIRVATAEEIDRDMKLAISFEKRQQNQMEARFFEPLTTVMVNIDYADAKVLKDNIQDLLAKDAAGKTRGSVRVDEHTNSLIIQATRDDLKRIVPIIEKIDKPAYQIQIRANIVETTKDTARSLGVQWGGMYGHKIGDQGLWITPGGTGAAGATTPPGIAFSGGYNPTSQNMGIGGQGFGVNLPAPAITAAAGATGSLGLIFGEIGRNILEVQLNALQREGKLNILSSPSITTLDNQKAFTENGERIPFVSTDREGNRTVSFQDAVLRLEITPHVIDGKYLRMKIQIKKDEVDRSRTVDGNPFIIKKLTETTLIVNDGETIVISGLTKHKRDETDTGIPFMMDLPFLRWLFKSQGRQATMEEVLIFITPTILPPRVAASVSEGKPPSK